MDTNISLKDLVNNHNATALHFAAYSGKIDIMKMLIKVTDKEKRQREERREEERGKERGRKEKEKQIPLG